MLYWIAKLLAVHHTAFHAFSYLTLRAILAVMSALSLALLLGPVMISRLSRYQIGQVVRNDGPRSHLPKAGTPTMGGALIIVAIAISTLLWADLRNRFVWITLGVTVGFGVIGFCDDYLKSVPVSTVSATPEDDQKKLRFFRIVAKLPIELQMMICNRLFGLNKDLILTRSTEPAFKLLARACLSEGCQLALW